MRPEELLLHADFVRRLSRSLVFDEHRTADLAQDALTAALEKPPPSDDSLKAWLARVTRNIARNLLRGEIRRGDREKAAARPDRVPSAAAVAEREEIRRRVVDAVLGLPKFYRSVVLLRFYEGLPPRKAAKELGIPVETVKTRIKRGLALLRERLDADHRGDRRKWLLALAPFAGAAPSSSAAIFTGIFTMSTKTKALAAAIILLGITLSLFFLLPEEQERFAIEPIEKDLSFREENVSSGENAEEAPELEVNTTERQAVASAAPKLTLSGRILSNATGLGIEGAEISACILPVQADLPEMTARTDKAGDFSMIVPALGDVEVYAVNFRVSAKGYTNLETPLPWEGEDLERSGLSFYLDETRTYAFKVLDTSGEAVANAKVEFFSPAKNRTMAIEFADFDGTVRVQDRDLGWAVGYMTQDWIIFKATAPGMAPHLAGFKTDLTEIRMSPEGTWTCRVTDSETKEGVAGARVLIHGKDNPRLDAWLGFEEITTDGFGVFRVPRFTLAWRFNLSIKVRAPGYMTKVSSLADFMMNLADSMMNKSDPFTGSVDETVLRPMHMVKTIRVIDAACGKPIPGLEIHLSLNYNRVDLRYEDTVVTDEGGCFECPFLRQERNYMMLWAPGYCDLFRPFPHPDAMREDPWPLRLLAQAPERVQIVDAFDRPIPGIRVQLVQPSEDGCARWSDLFADGEGIVEINPSFIPPGTKVWFRIFEQGISNNFAPFCTEPFIVGASDGKLRKIILRRGTLLQNIRVVDASGNPMKAQKVVAVLNVGKGMTMAFDDLWRVGAVTDQRGFCDIVFPRFLDGTIGVCERPDTDLPITFEDVVNQKEIILVMESSYLSQSGIHGKVFDDTGYPLDGLTILLESIEDDEKEERRPKDERKTITAPDGTFRTTVERNRTYSLRIHPFHRKDAQGRERWFHGIHRSPVVAGANLDIKLDAWPNHVEVRVMDCGFPAEDCEAWMESEDGTHVMVNLVKKGVHRYQSAKGQTANIIVHFYGVPAKKLRAVIRTDGGRMFKSDPLEVESGKSISSLLKIDE